MKTTRKIAAIVLLLLLGAVAYGLFRTGQPASAPAMNTKSGYGGAAQASIVDQTPLLTAQRLGQMPTSTEEQPFAEEALRLGDHEMDLAFAAAVLDAEENPPVLSAQAKETEARLQKAERALDADKARVAQLTAAYEKASGDRKDALDDQLDVAKAQQELDQDEIDDATQDLIRAGGDPKSRIQTMIEEHEAASHAADSFHVVVTNAVDERIDDQKQLAETYGNWIEAIAAKQRAVVHNALNGLSFILGILLIGIFFDSWLERLLGKTSFDRRQVETMRTLTRVSVQIFAVIFILLVIFGPPSQLGTILGLAGAGLTVALKDFIVGFLGWFVLMGKNGVRLGDWVEINGVTGEVVELGMFHTVLLETGNWTDSG